ncbi:MAG TPA: DNA-processing protein DprA [Thermodesulfobacteriota bacterium]|nr:DNA-processing protein DprA [Thermodesulfobacteriota bacterium]
MNIKYISKDDLIYPSELKSYMGGQAPQSIIALGNLDILRQKKLALFCSVKCPGSLILKTYDLAQSLRQAGISVIGGFHSPIERECLSILLRGTEPIVICPARDIEGMRMPRQYKQPLMEGRLLFLSPFTKSQHRATVQTATYRNLFVAALASSIFIAYAEPNSKTEQFCRDVFTWQKPLYTLDNEANRNLIELGAKPVSLNDIHNWI